MRKKKIGVLVGSLRKGSYSGSVANCVIGLAPEEFEMQIIEIGNLPIYNQDYDGEKIEVYEKFRETIRSLDGVLIVTAEHNRSIPAVLKNALDAGSRPYGQNAWNDKPGAIISQSYGVIGGFGANHHLRQVTTFLNIHMMSQPECYLSSVGNYIDDNGVLTAERTIGFLKRFMDSFKDWVNKFVAD